MAQEQKPEFNVRYSDEELQEFKAIILDMLEKARAEYKTLRATMTRSDSNDIDDTGVLRQPLSASRTRPTAFAA